MLPIRFSPSTAIGSPRVRHRSSVSLPLFTDLMAADRNQIQPADAHHSHKQYVFCSFIYSLPLLGILSLWPDDTGFRSTVQCQDNPTCSHSRVSQPTFSYLFLPTNRHLADIHSSSSLVLNSTLGQALDGATIPSQDQVLFWESGMDRNINYTVDINILPGHGQWGISKLVTFDATYVANRLR